MRCCEWIRRFIQPSVDFTPETAFERRWRRAFLLDGSHAEFGEVVDQGQVLCRASIGIGVLRGAFSPYQFVTSSFGTPASAEVGTFGARVHDGDGLTRDGVG